MTPLQQVTTILQATRVPFHQFKEPSGYTTTPKKLHASNQRFWALKLKAVSCYPSRDNCFTKSIDKTKPNWGAVAEQVVKATTAEFEKLHKQITTIVVVGAEHNGGTRLCFDKNGILLYTVQCSACIVEADVTNHYSFPVDHKLYVMRQAGVEDLENSKEKQSTIPLLTQFGAVTGKPDAALIAELSQQATAAANTYMKTTNPGTWLAVEKLPTLQELAKLHSQRAAESPSDYLKRLNRLREYAKLELKKQLKGKL